MVTIFVIPHCKKKENRQCLLHWMRKTLLNGCVAHLGLRRKGVRNIQTEIIQENRDRDERQTIFVFISW